MADLLVLLRLVLIITFAVAGTSKLADLPGFRKSLAEFGVPPALRKPAGHGLPLIELCVALLLTAPATAWSGAVAAGSLLLVFSLVMAWHLAHGRRPACNCFGQARAAPIGVSALMRNGVLMLCSLALALLGAHTEPVTLLSWFEGLYAQREVVQMLLLLLTAAVLFGGWVVLQLLRQQGRLLLRIDNLELRLARSGLPALAVSPVVPMMGLDIGTLAPRFSASQLAGGVAAFDHLLSLHMPVILVFSDPACGPCVAMAPLLEQWQRDLTSRASIVLVSRGSAADNVAKFGASHLDHVFLQSDREIATLYGAAVTPSALRISAKGLIDSHLALGDLAIEGLVGELLSWPADSPPAASVQALGDQPFMA